MSNDMTDHMSSAHDALKFIAYAFKAYEIENNEPFEVNNALLAGLIKDDSIESINLTFEFDSERDMVMIQAVENGDE